MTQSFSIQEYCAKNAIEAAAANAAALNFPESTKQFWESLQLPTRHPFCNHDNLETYFSVDGIPPMGALEHRFEDESPWEKLVTIWFMVAPPLLAMAELWLRLVAGILGSLGCIYLTRALWLGRRHQQAGKQRTERTNNEFLEDPKDRRKLGGFCLLTVASSLVLMTDTYYVLNNGATPGALIFLIAVGLAIWTCFRYQLTTASVGLWLLVLLSIHLVWDTNTGKLHFGNREEQVNLSEGLYFDSSNDYIQSVVDNWPETHRTYSVATGATPWMPSGDSRTGLPFLINHLSAPDWHRLFVRTLEPDEEYVALDIAFPREGVQTSQPLYMILHGLNGGSAEEYIRDFARRRTEEGSTVAVMVARGLMDLPVRGWDIFHGARTVDAHAAATALRNALGDDQVLIGVGYSMGAIVLSNYVASAGPACALDGAFSISGGLDMRFQENFERAKRLWQPMLAGTLRRDFLLGKWGKRVHARLSKDELLRMMRATHVTEIDEYAVVPYNGFRDLNDYYTSMSALGDIPWNTEGLPEVQNTGKINSITIPFCVLHAFDDPLVTWRATVNNEGFMNPESLVKSGSGNLMLLLTKSGGHVGWPLGIFPFKDKWKWMNDAAMTFGQAVATAKMIQHDESMLSRPADMHLDEGEWQEHETEER